MRITDVRVAGIKATSQLEVDETVLRIDLPEPVETGGSALLSFHFETTIPTDSTGTYGIFSHDTRYDTWILADWYPVIAGFEPGEGWWLDAPTPEGDPTFSDAALYDVTIDAPSALTLIGSGRSVETTSDGDRTATRFLTGPVREFALIAVSNFVVTSTEVAGTTINLYLNADTSVTDGAEVALSTAASALASYSDRYGPYPYDEFDLVETDLSSSVLAVAWSGLIFLEGPDFLTGVRAGEGAEFIIAHEVGHQWWGAVVGANSNDHTFMNEGLTNALTAVYVEDEFDQAEAEAQIRQQIVDRYLSALAKSGDGIVDLPISAPRNGPSRGALDYGKAAIGLLAIRQELGDDVFFDALAAYADRYAFDNASPDDLRDAFEEASDRDLSELWRFWFNAAETTAADVERVFADS